MIAHHKIICDSVTYIICNPNLIELKPLLMVSAIHPFTLFQRAYLYKVTINHRASISVIHFILTIMRLNFQNVNIFFINKLKLINNLLYSLGFLLLTLNNNYSNMYSYRKQVYLTRIQKRGLL